MAALKLAWWGRIIVAVLIFLIGQALPQVWKWKESRLGQEQHELAILKQTIDLRDKIEDKLTKLVMLSKEIRQEENTERRKEITAQVELIQDDLISNEEKLAKLQKRTPRDVFKALAPPPPTDFKVELK